LGEWDDQYGAGYRGGKRRNWARIAKFAIIGGFVVLAAVMAAFFIPRAGLHVEIIQRSEVVGTMQTVSVRITNNSLETMRGVTVQFDSGEPFELGDLGPFQGRLLTPDEEDLGFGSVTASANDGAVMVTKHRDPTAVTGGH
jgi:uncharacterized protein (DUF58 family)